LKKKPKTEDGQDDTSKKRKSTRKSKGPTTSLYEIEPTHAVQRRKGLGEDFSTTSRRQGNLITKGTRTILKDG